MSEVLLGQSYYLRFDPKLWQAMQPYPPLGTLYAASLARSRGYDVALFDAMLAESEAEWESALSLHRPRFAVLFEDNFNYLSKMCLLRMRQAAFTMAEMGKRHGATVIACGSDATDHAELYLAHGVDYVLLGEGEATLLEVLDRLTGRSGQPLDQIRGLAYRSEQASGGIRLNPRRPDLRDLDSLPFPAWDLVDVERYRGIWLRRHGHTSMNMVTTRGCPYHCNWCAKPIWGQRYNVRSPENVVAEMKWLKTTYAPDHIWFADDILGLKPGWLERFADLVEQEQVRTPFKSLHRVDLLLRGQTIDALRRAGARTVWVGAESGTQEILDAMEKGTSVEQIGEAARRLHAAGIQVGFFLQFGYPGERMVDIRRTLDLVRTAGPDDIGVSVSYPLPGTKFHARVQEQLGSRQNWVDSSDLSMLYQGPFGTAFYRRLHSLVHREFRLREAWRQISRALRGGRIPAPRAVGRLVINMLALPLDRLRLFRLASAPNDHVGTLPGTMTHQAAATPSPQAEG